MPFSIVSYEFSKPVREIADSNRLLSNHPQGSNWPVVYLLHGDREIYIGETNNASERMNQHMDPKGKYFEKRKKVERVEIIFDSWFNKSAILDIENALISLFRFEIKQTKDEAKKSKYFDVLQNGNRGQSKLHNYYNRAYYQDEVESIWGDLKKMSLATNDYHDIVNDVLFKYSPYTALNEEQQNVTLDILNGIMDSLEAKRRGEVTDYTAVVNGVAGTGKTVVLINMLVRIVEAIYSNQTNFDSDNDDVYETNLALGELSPEAKLVNRIKEYVQQYGKLKIAYVAQMTSLRKTMGTIFKDVPHLYANTAKGPNDIVNTSFDTTGEFEPYDVLFVDEAHRLWQYKNIGSAMGSYKHACEKLYGEGVPPEDYTTLDWICKCSRTRVLIYDPFQTVKDSDITPKQFNDAVFNTPETPHFYELKQQMRCRAGSDFIGFVNSLFNGDYASASALRPTKDYDFRFYDDPNELIEEIVKRNAEAGLSKCATGYGWQWERNRYDECKRKYNNWLKKSGEKDTRKKQLAFYLDNLTVEDGLIEFDGKKYVRNLDFDWILKGEPQEIGCIHTSQGYDLNYVGVLFGPEINYDPGKGIIVDPKLIKDKSVSRNLAGLPAAEYAAKYDAIKNYVINAYKVMMERGIKGCYIYAHNPELRAHLKSLISGV